MLTQCYKGMFPGLNLALGIFGTYLVVKYAYQTISPEEHFHGSFQFSKAGIGATPEPSRADGHGHH